MSVSSVMSTGYTWNFSPGRARSFHAEGCLILQSSEKGVLL